MKRCRSWSDGRPGERPARGDRATPEQPEDLASRFSPVALPDRPYLAALQAYCLSFDGAWEDYPWGDIVCKVGPKIFTYLGATSDIAGLTVKATKEDADVLVERPGVSRARYIGRHGWVTVQITDDADFDLAKDLIATSYALVRPRSRATSKRVDRSL
jgi:predicted DNA-binding protein (MmcQ/YjbR family)